MWWDVCSLQLFQEVQSFAGFGYNGIDVAEDRLEALLLLQCHGEHCPTNDVLSAFDKKARLCSVAEIVEVCEVK